MTEEKRETARRFGNAADAYLASDTHRQGADLETLAGWCAQADRALDVATGAGHTAGAILDTGVAAVVAIDAAPEMVATAVGQYGVLGAVADAERLPFAPDAFDAVSCRIAAHHFPDQQAFVDEVARVLESGGVFAFEDNVAPADPTLATWLDDVERLRDPSHGTLHTLETWIERIEAAGFSVEETHATSATLDFDEWVSRTNVPAADRRELERRFREAPPGAHDRFDVQFDENGDVVSWANPKALIRAQTPG